MNDVIGIMFFFHDSNLNNGAVRSMVDVIVSLMKTNKFKIIVIYPDKAQSAIPYLESKGVICKHIRYGRWDYPLKASLKKRYKHYLKNLAKGLISLMNMYKLKEIIINEKIDVLYTNTITVYIGSWLSRYLRIPHVWHIREFGKEDHNLGIMFGRKRLINSLTKNTDEIFYISNCLKSKYDQELHKDVKNRVIYNDISNEFENRKIVFNKDYILNVGIIGAIQEGKGQLDVIKAVEIVNKDSIKVKLHIAGLPSGDYYNICSSYIEKHQLSDFVFFDGFVTEMNKYRSYMDIGIVSSTNEAFGRVTIEGMLSEMAMIGADCGGTKELIVNGVTGLLYPLHDINALAGCINKFVYNRDYMIEIAKHGFRYAHDMFTVSKAAEIIGQELIMLKKEVTK